jgi:nitroreductase
MTSLLTVAMLAPSPRGRQPWRYQVHLGSQTIDLYADAERARRYGDPSGRAVHIACGAALVHLRLAAAVAGRQAVLRLLPEPGRPRLLATFRLSGPHRVRPDEEELYAALSGLLGAPDGGSADDEDRAVGELDDLVRGAAQNKPGQLAAAP